MARPAMPPRGTKRSCVCGGELLVCHGPKLGPYWRHNGTKNCKFAPKPMTAWHRRWQELCDRPNWLTEQIVEAADGTLHYADAVTSHGQVIEFQHSKIDPAEVAERNSVHDPLIWILDGPTTAGTLSVDDRTATWL